MDFWKRLNALIKERKVTQEWVANQLGIKYPTFKNWSARHIIPDAVQSVAIAQVLNTSVEYLVTGEESDSSKNQLLEIKKQLEQMLASLR